GIAGCCARAAIGQAVAPPRILMNSRRLIASPQGLGRSSYQPASILWKGSGTSDVRFGSEADTCAAQMHVRFTPNSDRKSGRPQNAMSALPPKADVCGALAHVC